MQQLSQMLGFNNMGDANDFDLSTQLKLTKENSVPECYDASNSYSPSVHRSLSTNSFNDINDPAKQRVASSISILQSTRPAVEHGVASSASSIKDLNHVTVQQVI
uniref:Uncharacterized protein n=1 Tax=Eucampia antarctica TaxID=49252 RepID=A0A7S2S3D1_9STRA|mmetsp:Transcript_29823/g.28699  ORF Transcript_29823/g.28699 Transcript_29823/m.28699 type:complete len:105 (+) Transcript_29823:241-555(+)